MRKQLAKINQVRATFRGVFERFGIKSGWKGRTETTVLLKDITDPQTGAYICDYLWFNLTEQFKALHLEPGDVVQFDARVRQYEKGYKSRREDVDDHRIETDYKLSYPTRVVEVKAPPAQSGAGAEKAQITWPLHQLADKPD